MVRTGPRPAHRKGTAGARWARFRAQQIRDVTHCQNPVCGKPLIRHALCTHPTHQRLRYCPTHHAYPPLEHPHRLVDGGRARDPDNALVYCYSCNSRGGGRTPPTPKAQALAPSRAW